MGVRRAAPIVCSSSGVGVGAGLLVVLLMIGGVMTVMGQSGDARAQLLPTGTLRVGINTGNPVTRAVAADIAGDLASRLGVAMTLIEYPTPGAVSAAVGRDWDVAFVAADPGREGSMAFTPAYMELDATYLVRGDAPFQTVVDVDREGVTIATGTTSAYTLVLQRTLTHARLVLGTNDESIRRLHAGTADAAAGLREALRRQASRVPGSRLLPDNITRAQQAIAVPKAHDAALAYLATYLAELKKSSLIAASIAKTGAVGASPAP